MGANNPPLLCYQEKILGRQDYWALKIEAQGGRPPEFHYELGDWVGGQVWLGSSATGAYLQFLRIPGFPQRFLVGMGVGDSIRTPICTETPFESCFVSYDYRPFPYDHNPRLLSAAAVSDFLPAVTDREGRLGGELEWVVQYTVPRNWVQFLAGLYDLAERLERDPHPLTGKAFTFKQAYTFAFGPQGEGSYSLEERTRDLRYASELDPYPISQGGNKVVAIQVWWCQLVERITGRPCAENGNVERAWRAQFRWTNQAYYAFGYASGHITPPVPLCAPGVGWTVKFYLTVPQLRNEPFDYASLPDGLFAEDIRRAEDPYRFLIEVYPFWAYVTHGVRLVGRDVVGYLLYDDYHNPIKTPLYYTMDAGQNLTNYPLYGWGTPPPGQTVRMAVLYRDTISKPGDWQPHPSHPLGEDNWHIVWSDVHLGGTLANPDCRVEAIGYHMYDLATSAQLDDFFGLAETPTPPRWYSPGTLFRTLPLLTRIGEWEPVLLGNVRFKIPAGSFQLPDWALPPGW
ncbi:hypothetical protein [Thermus altitudinis]|uniref:hypothetical protein n=1 Tax=Thermus altitudinis TaxID=2908145 RepID=UPI001FAAD36B|nr:hypothetical protein [Thermus altitudinis]